MWERLKTFGVGSGVSEEERVIREEFDKLDTGKLSTAVSLHLGTYNYNLQFTDGSGFISKSEMMATIAGCDFLGNDR